MRRTRRHKFLQISVFFLLYSIINVFSENSSQTPDKPVEKEVGSIFSTKQPTATEKSTTTTPESRHETTPKSKKIPDKKNNTNGMPPCTPPAIQQFPKPLIGPKQRKEGGIIVHIIVAIYTFLGLAIVCDEYFVASLDRICEELKMSPDVAGATFMAAGSSAPELATVVIGVFFAKDDIGISGVIGSAVFNIMFVISVCALCTTTVIYLNWWPLIRDCFFYAVSILVMLITIQDKVISWVESLFMLLMYMVYCVVLHYNSYLEQWAQRLPIPCKKVAPDEQSGLVSYKTLEEEGKHPNYGISPERPMEDEGFEAAAAPEHYKNVAMNYLNFILEHSKIPIGGVVARAEFGAPDCGCSPTHDGDSIYRKHCRTALLYYGHGVRAGCYGRKLAFGLDYWAKSTALRHLDRP
ncbi:hypothetical protein Zmor_002757 [Zophobas morio]|uniref:Sodium/calcium exchanger membrane region domain-containing protein n=1 Tax=Zophobas morio TaxID=2755281 RepID=A0AA38M0U6_9CUCU|nr:hypothetical protein Zmor_002757 [Zophobas morio]